MKKVPFLVACICLFILCTNRLLSQEKPQLEAKLQLVEEEGPKLYKFEPDYQESNDARRKEILLMKTLIDSLDLSEGKRQKLIRDLYRNKGSKKLQKILLANNQFEEEKE
ncbi:hypothetical protein [uncultured Eudoraea sp.]|uniref:hypothetical protein n=1 Tax=uncultured Eudoraea sp. TaxID=1035614 RepID=UPI00263302BD|nr:hypothetical protein [uncultured Eudoraea sp.]